MENDSKTTRLIILSDGKKGHLNQSLAVADLSGAEERKIIEVRYKRKIYRVLFAFLIYLPLSKYCLKRLIQMTFMEETGKELLEEFPAHIVISAGASLSGINHAVSKIHNAKSVVIMKPPFGGKKFDLKIIPKHDNPSPSEKNTVVVLGAPNRITSADLAAESRRLSSSFQIPREKNISVFIGGNSRKHRFTPPFIENLMARLERVCNTTGRNLLMTTSRRTPKDIHDIIIKRMSGFPRCRLMAAPHDDEITVAGMMGLAELIVVTEDSISMISEAASSGKKVIIVALSDNRLTKHRRMIEALKEAGYVAFCRMEALEQMITDKLADPIPPRRLDDNANIRAALQRIL